jgi:hypothetical protein
VASCGSRDAGYNGHEFGAQRQAALPFERLNMGLLRRSLAEVRIKRGQWDRADNAMLDARTVNGKGSEDNAAPVPPSRNIEPLQPTSTTESPNAK